MTQPTQNVDVKKLTIDQIKALIFDSSEIINLHDRNINFLRQELNTRTQAVNKTFTDAVKTEEIKPEETPK